MSHTNESGSIVDELKPHVPYPVVLGIVLVATYSIAQGTSVLQDLVVPNEGRPVSAPAMGGTTQSVEPAIVSFGNLAGNFLTGAPVFVLFAIGVAALVVYQGRSLLHGTLLSITLTLGVFVGVMSVFVIVDSGKLPFLIGSALLLGLLYGGVGSLLGAGVRFASQ